MTLLQACDFAEYAWNNSDVWDQKTDTHVAFKQDGTTLYVCFRGSESLQDAIDDIEFWNVPWRAGIWVAEGFRDCYEAVEGAIEAKIEAVKPAQVIYVGHSLGAFLAVMGTVASMLRGRLSPAYAIGCPRGFGFLSAIRLNKKLKDLVTWWRNDQDIITHLAPWCFWKLHVGKEIQVGKWWRWWTFLFPNSHNAHMVSQYRLHAGGE